MFQVAQSLSGVAGGALVTVFSLGIFFPRANATVSFYLNWVIIIIIRVIVAPVAGTKYLVKKQALLSVSGNNGVIVMTLFTVYYRWIVKEAFRAVTRQHFFIFNLYMS